MTLQARPTFSESWYRVKDLKAKLRASAQVSRQFYRGERWYVVRDPAGNQYHRLSDPAYRFVGLLDGSRTVSEAWDLAGGHLEDDAPTQPEVIQILTHLYSANLIDADITPDATVLLRRHKSLSKRKMQSRLMNVLFPRLPIWDPDQFLKRWMPIARILFSKFGALVWIAVVGTALAMLAPYWKGGQHSLTSAAKHAIDIKSNTINVIYMWAVFVFVKLIHELGHAFSCRRFGGECHELGIMLLVFVPTPYVDASSAWSFPNKWHRIFVGAAGMIVELFFASLCAFIWMRTGDPNSLIAQLAFNAMLVASVTTVLFNANPLLRYDGYYILSDYLEIPNLRQKSSEYALGLIKRHVFGVKSQNPLPSPLQRFWLLFYSIASSIYRVFIGVLIIVMVAFQVPILGILMSLGGVATWLVVPIYKLFKYLALDAELHRKRTKAVAFSLAVIALVITGIGFIPMPYNVDEAAAAEAAAHQAIFPPYIGMVTEIVAHDGDKLKKGDVILVADDYELDKNIKQQVADLEFYQDKIAIDTATGTDQLAGDRAMRDAVQLTLDLYNMQKQQLTIRAPIDGTLIAPDLHNMMGTQLKHDSKIGIVQDASVLNVKVLLEQANSELIMRVLAASTRSNPATQPATSKDRLKIEVRLASNMDETLVGGVPRLYPKGSTDSPGSQVTQQTGQEAAPDPRDPRKLKSPEFEIDLPVSNPGEKYVTGQTAYVHFKLGWEPVAYRWYRRVLQVLQSRPSSPLI